jgi:hypothetical protein
MGNDYYDDDDGHHVHRGPSITLWVLIFVVVAGLAGAIVEIVTTHGLPSL